MRAERVKYEMKSIIKHTGRYAVKVFKIRTAHSPARWQTFKRISN